MCLCVTRRYCIKTAKRHVIAQAFCHAKRVDDSPSPRNLHTTISTNIPSASTVRAGDKSSISTNSKSTTILAYGPQTVPEGGVVTGT